MRTEQLSRLNPSNIASPGGHYSHATVAGGFVFVSGQVSLGSDGTVIAPGNVYNQTLEVVRRIESILTAAGGGLSDIVFATIYLHDVADFEEFNAAWASALGECAPSRATVGAAIAVEGLLVEIHVIALQAAPPDAT